MAFESEIHDRRSIRLKGYDYTQPGAYFVTVVSFQRGEIFGEIVDGRMSLSALGDIVHEEWMRSGQIRKEIQVFADEFVIMPNHVHGIVRIIEITPVDGGAHVGADGVCLEPRRAQAVRSDRADPRAHAVRPYLYRPRQSLGSFVAGFKSAITSRAERELHLAGIWQRGYYDHIIRNEEEFMCIWKYIDANPLHWQEDAANPFSLPANLNW